MSDAATPRITVLDDGRIVLRTPYNDLKYWSALTISGADGDRVVSREGTFAQERLL